MATKSTYEEVQAAIDNLTEQRAEVLRREGYSDALQADYANNWRKVLEERGWTCEEFAQRVQAIYGDD